MPNYSQSHYETLKHTVAKSIYTHYSSLSGILNCVFLPSWSLTHFFQNVWITFWSSVTYSIEADEKFWQISCQISYSSPVTFLIHFDNEVENVFPKHFFSNFFSSSENKAKKCLINNEWYLEQMREKPLYANSFCKVKVTCIHFNQSYVFHSFEFNSYLHTIKMCRIFSTLLSMSHNLQQFFESNILKILSNHRVMMLKNSFYDHSFEKIFKRRTRVCAL